MANKKKIIGWKGLILTIIYFIPINYISYKVGKHEIILFIMALYFTFTALYRISSTSITILTLNPFRWRRNIVFEEIERAIVTCDKLSGITLYLKTGKKINTGLFFIKRDALELFNLFKDKNIPVTSTGIYTIDWPS